MKTEVVMFNESQHDDWRIGDKGYVDGYVRGGDNTPYAVIVLKNGQFVLAPFSAIRVTNTKQ